ncbi:hypothetical protein Moror_15765 [Moniliophthora roreri MCA 2997]|uniref:Uncharacterized protein n=1 Tax=Moniliophthora roreri (strain MCA 2997) TaxID=1381753 RepID=V2WGV1_MONRO|nr:hypothetical protein Moror_15765 [Moniliophthora roreri MCA 2997]
MGLLRTVVDVVLVTAEHAKTTLLTVLAFFVPVEEEEEEPWSEDLELPELELEPEFLLKDEPLLSLPPEPELVPDFGPED